MQLSYHEIWNGLENLAKAKGLSLSAMAHKAGLDPTSFNRSKRIGADGRKRWPSTESMNKVLKAMDVTVFEFMEYAGQPLPQPKYTIPLLGLAKAGREGYFDSDGYPLSTDEWDGIDFPMQLGRGVYALEVSGNSMEPVYRAGDKLVVQPDSEVRINDRIVVKIKTGEVMVKELVHKSAKKIELKSLNPLHELITLEPNDVCWMARVIWVSQ
ncbi:MAG: helix-turn-helix transcriptional regulator [Alphaproteobacteria bacterium]|nr:helix-turn-helix transcriptional regulator [Alphaproteobacteria bacterium]